MFNIIYSHMTNCKLQISCKFKKKDSKLEDV